MKFSHFFIDRPIFAMVLSLVILLGGRLALLGLPMSRNDKGPDAHAERERRHQDRTQPQPDGFHRRSRISEGQSG